MLRLSGSAVQALCIEARYLQLAMLQVMQLTTDKLAAHAVLVQQCSASSVHQGQISAADNVASDEADDSKADCTCCACPAVQCNSCA